MRGLISSMGFSQIGFEYDRRARVAGKGKFPFKAMLGLAVDGVLNHSLVPLRIASAVGLLVGSSTFVLMFVYLAGRLIFGQDWPAGFATTTRKFGRAAGGGEVLGVRVDLGGHRVVQKIR